MLVRVTIHRLHMTSSKDLVHEHHGMNSSQVHLHLHKSSSHGIMEHWHGEGGHGLRSPPPFTMRKPHQESEQSVEVKQLASDRTDPEP